MDLPNDPAAARQRLLRQFADDIARLLAADATPFGQLTCSHIGRQLDLAASERYTHWFRDPGERFGFDQGVTLAAVAGSDVTRASPFSETARRNFGTTAERVADLADRGELLYGRVFDTYGPLENLYMHAEGGRHFARAELSRRGATDQTAVEVAEAIVGHDSFNAGFGRHRLKPLLAAKYGEPSEAFDYPAARSPSGFLVQILDRLEACDPRTMVRYVTEGVEQRNESIAQAIKTGLIDNAAFLAEARDRILADARRLLTADQMRVLLDFPGLRDLDRGVRQLPGVLALVGSLESDGFYHLHGEGGRVRLDSLDGFVRHFLASASALEERSDPGESV